MTTTTEQLTMTERFPIGGCGTVFETACGVLATATNTLATQRALRGLGTCGYLIYWRSSPGQCGYLAFLMWDKRMPKGADHATPGKLINAGFIVRNALRDQFIADAGELPILDPKAYDDGKAGKAVGCRFCSRVFATVDDVELHEVEMHEQRLHRE